MIRNALPLAAAAVLALGGCTSGETVAPAPTAGATVTVTAAAPSATAAPATCSASPIELTYRRHVVAFAGEEYDLSPTSRATLHGLPHISTVRAAATKLGGGSDLVSRIGRHWHVHLEALGRTTASHQLSGAVGLRNRSGKDNVAYAVFRYARVYSGSFTNACGGSLVTGRYTTFGTARTAVFDCARRDRSELGRVAHRLCI